MIKLPVQAFHLVYERYGVRGGDLTVTTSLVFALEGRTVAVVHRMGWRGRDAAQGVPGVGIGHGIGLRVASPVAGDPPSGGRLQAMSCALDFGLDPDCDVHMGGKCVWDCEAALTVEVYQPARLTRCLQDPAKGLEATVAARDQPLHAMDLLSPCVFLQGDALAVLSP